MKNLLVSFKETMLQGVASENGSKKMRVNPRTTPVRFAFALLLLLTFGVGNAWGETMSLTFEGSGTFPNNSSWTVSNGSENTTYNHTSSGSKSCQFSSTSFYVKTNDKISGTISNIKYYATKNTTNSTSTNVYIQTSTDGSSWTTVNTFNIASTTRGTFTEVSQDLTANNKNVYVRISRGGSSTAVRIIDDIIITYTAGTKKTLSYEANGASGEAPSDANEYDVGDKATVLGRNTLYKVGYTFNGWNTVANGSGTPYAAGDKFTIGASGNTLYAQWTNTYAGDEFSLVEDLSDLSAGSKIVIIGTDAGGTNFYALKTTQQSTYRDRVASGSSEFTMSNSNKTCTLGASTSVQVITLEDLATPASNTYQFNVENGYLYASSSSSNDLKTQTTNNANGHWLIGLVEGVFTITAQGTNTRNVLSHNNSASRFSCYTGNQQPTYIYVKDEGTKYGITWNKNGHGTAPTSPTNASKVTLPDISVTGYTNTGWKANVAVTNASTSASISAGTLITPGTRVQLGAATTFTAQWENATYTISSTLTNCSSSPAIPSSYTYTGSAAGLSYTITPSSGFALPSSITVSGTTYTWDNTTGALSLTGTIESNVSITITAQRLYTVTFSKGTGTCATTSLQGTNADGITLPTPTHSCSSEGWSFAGWTTGSLVTSETTTAPATLYTGGSNYKPSSNITLYAVYQKGDGKYHKITSTPETIPGKYVIANVTAGQAIKNATISGYSYYLAAQSVIISSNEIASPDASCVWDVTYESSKWIFKNGSNYFYNIYESSHHNLKLNSTKPSGYSVSFSGDIATLASADDDGYHVMYYYYSGGSTHEFKSSADGDNLTLFRLDKIYYSNPTCCSNKITIGTPSVTGIGTVTFTYGGDAVVAGDEIETCDDDIEIIATVTPASGYACSELSFTGGSVAVSPTIGAGNRPAYPSSQEYTLSFTSGTNATLSTSVTFTAKTLSSISLSPSSGEVYVGQYVDFTVSYDPADYISQGYTLNATPTYVAKESAAPAATKLRLKGGRGSGPGASITTTVNETVTIKASGDNTKTASVNMTVNPLPYVTFVDHVHNKTDFIGMTDGKVTEEIVANALSGTKTTPTHADIAAPGSGSDCEKSHLHLVGWILSTWADANPTASGATITGAGAGNFYAAGASIDIAAQNGKTYYAVWSKIE